MAAMVTRRRFAGGLPATAGVAFLPRSAVSLAFACDGFPCWREGELELHFIHTGCGENCFYILPDGTTILNDTGDFHCPEAVRDIPLMPSAERLGGEWVARYISRVWHPWQMSSGKTLARLASRKLHDGRDALVVPTFMTKKNAEKFAGSPFMKNIPEETRHGVHVAVKVAPGGGECTMCLIDARDESMRVVRRIGLPV